MPATVSNPRDLLVELLGRLLHIERRLAGAVLRDLAGSVQDDELRAALEAHREETRAHVERLQALYDADGSAFQVEEIAGGYQLLTRPRYHPWLARLKRTGHELKLSPAALETLAVVAYKHPIMRAEVEKVRGVACGEVIRQLMEKGLLRIAGRHDSLGRPQLYGTTKKFLQAFGLNALQDLPEVESLKYGDVTKRTGG